MVTTVHIGRSDVTKILIDIGSHGKILFLATFDRMGFDQKQLREPSKPLYGFGGERIEPIRAITLPVSLVTMAHLLRWSLGAAGAGVAAILT
jgi:hypothetical protein